MEPTTVVALYLALTACPVGSTCVESAKDRYEMSFQTKHNDSSQFNYVEISKNQKTIFILHADGSVEHAPDFEPNIVALNFWKSMGQNYPNVCMPELETK